MRIFLETREGRPGLAEFTTALIHSLHQNDIDVATESGEADMIIAVGGDGTMLSAVAAAQGNDVPVLGFNLGTFGFLTSAEPENLELVVTRLKRGDYTLEDRLTVAAVVHGATSHGVNDVVIEKVDSQRLIELRVEIGSTPFATYRADGLIVATPTGSTAYSFSAGGPLVDPSLNAFVLTPVATHSLFSRSVVIPSSEEIVVTIERDRTVKVNVDKQELGHLNEGERVTIRQGDRPVRFVRLDNLSFPGLVRLKFDLP